MKNNEMNLLIDPKLTSSTVGGNQLYLHPTKCMYCYGQDSFVLFSFFYNLQTQRQWQVETTIESGNLEDYTSPLLYTVLFLLTCKGFHNFTWQFVQ